MADEESQKSCFVIAPIGGKGSDTRIRSDQVFDHIINPTVSKVGYRAERADKITAPGMITDQVIERLLDDDLVVADLTGRNANVFYELAIRHAIRKPVVIMIAEDDDLPFDVSQSRAIQFDYRDLDSVAACKAALEDQIRSLEKNPGNVFSPVSTAVDLRAMRDSGDPTARRDADILSAIQALQADMRRLELNVDRRMRQERRRLHEMFSADTRLTSEGDIRAYRIEPGPLERRRRVPPTWEEVSESHRVEEARDDGGAEEYSEQDEE